MADFVVNRSIAFSAENWALIEQIAKKYDEDGLFNLSDFVNHAVSKFYGSIED